MNGGESRELRLLRRELDLHLLIRKTIHQFKQADYSRLVDLMNDSTRRSLSQYTRDEASRVLWNIALSQPLLLRASVGPLPERPFFPRTALEHSGVAKVALASEVRAVSSACGRFPL